MALRFDASADMLSRTTTLPTITSFTLMGWFYLTTDRNASTAFFSLGSNPDNGGNLTYILNTLSDGTTFNWWNGAADTSGSALAVATWTHLACTVAGTGAGQALAYKNGVLDITTSGNASAAAGIIFMGNDNFAEFLNGRAAALKVYSAVLTAAEIKAEMAYFVPVRTANLNTWLPCVDLTAANNAINLSGPGGNMTIGGTLAVEDGPPLTWAPPVNPWPLRAPLLAM